MATHSVGSVSSSRHSRMTNKMIRGIDLHVLCTHRHSPKIPFQLISMGFSTKILSYLEMRGPTTQKLMRPWRSIVILEWPNRLTIERASEIRRTRKFSECNISKWLWFLHLLRWRVPLHTVRYIHRTAPSTNVYCIFNSVQRAHLRSFNGRKVDWSERRWMCNPF